MPEQITAYRVFIASPGGLEEEREAFRAAINAHNESDAIERGVIFLPVGWEITRGGSGRPQAIINEEVRRCDFFVLVLHDRWGSAPQVGEGPCSSGSEEELYSQDRFDDAEELFRRALDVAERTSGSQSRDAALSLTDLANVAIGRGEYEEAARLYRQALEALERSIGQDNPRIAVAYANLGMVEFRLGASAEAEAWYRRALALQESVFDRGHPELTASREGLAEVLRGQGRDEEADALLGDDET